MDGSRGVSRWVHVVVCCVVAVVLAGCTGGAGDAPDREPRGGTAGSAPEPGPPGPVTLTAAASDEEPVSDLEGLPSEFPDSLDPMPDFAPRPGVPARAVYRPPEGADDGTGWESEEVAVFRAGSWTRLSLASVGLDQRLWPGRDPMGAGELSPDGRLIAWDTDDGVAVLDLYRGSTRLLLSGTGPVTGSRWLPGSDGLLVQRPRATDRVVSAGNGTSSPSPVEARSATVLSSGDLARLTPTRDGSLLTVLPVGRESAGATRRVLDVPAGGRHVRGWGAGSRLAYYPGVVRRGPHEMRVVDLEGGRSRGTLRWSALVDEGLTVHGWASDGSVLVSTDGALRAWDPARRVVSLVATLPTSEDGAAEERVGLSVAPLLLTAS